MKILAFESSAKAASAALLSSGQLLAEGFLNNGLTHSRTLLLLAEQLLQNCGLTPQDIDAVGVAAGPGSFTGVRIGVAAAKGFCWGRQLPCLGISTLEAMVRGAAACDGVWCACMDARRQQVYTAVYAVADGKFTALLPDCAIGVDELGDFLKKLEKPVFLVGDGAALCYNALGQNIPALHLLPEHLRHQRAAGVALCAQDQLDAGLTGDAGALTPNYLRLSQAERARMEAMKNE